MAELTKKLHFKKNTTEHMAKAYSTTAEAGAKYITNKIDGVTAYIPIGEISNTEATIGRLTQNGTKAILKSGKVPYTKKEYRAPNAYTFTVPANIKKLRVTLLGAGGGGGGGNPDKTFTAGGGGGYYIKDTIMAVTPLSVLTVIVGAGGKGSNTGTAKKGLKGADGGDSKVGDIVAGGGGGGSFTIDDNEMATVCGVAGVGSGGIKGKNGEHPKGGNSGAGNAGGSQAGADGADGAGGAGGYQSTKGGNGGNGYVIIEYGGDIS